MASKLRSKSEFYLIGYEEPTILGAKLPTARQVLKTFFFHQTNGCAKKESAKMVAQEVSTFWEKVQIKTKDTHHCVEKVLKLHQEWNELKKNLKRSSKTEQKKREKFTEKLDILFDIAHKNAMNELDNESKEFLMNQRSQGRMGSIGGLNQNQMRKEKRQGERLGKELARKKKYLDEQERERRGKYQVKCLFF